MFFNTLSAFFYLFGLRKCVATNQFNPNLILFNKRETFGTRNLKATGYLNIQILNFMFQTQRIINPVLTSTVT